MPDSSLNAPTSARPPVLQLFATGGTIAGVASNSHSSVHYQAAALPVTALLEAVPALQQLPARIRAEQLLAKDSKDLEPEDWLTIARAVQNALQDPEVVGIVITHGTDTLEETAWFLHRSLPPSPKPVVLVSAMRPATALGADGPQNLWDACCAALSEISGVVCVAAGTVHSAELVQKQQPYRIPAFSSGEAGPLAWVEEGRVVWAAQAGFTAAQRLSPNTSNDATDLMSRGHYQALLSSAQLPPAPSVAWVTSHAGFEAKQIEALQAVGFDGVLVAGTGNASLHHRLQAALDVAADAGMAVAITSRCSQGHIVLPSNAPSHHRFWPLPAAKARLELLMELWLRNKTQ